jgi:hypothetical protein
LDFGVSLVFEFVWGVFRNFLLNQWLIQIPFELPWLHRFPINILFILGPNTFSFDLSFIWFRLDFALNCFQ